MNSNANVVGNEDLEEKVSSVVDIKDTKKRVKLYKDFTILRIFVLDFEHINIKLAREKFLAGLLNIQKQFKNLDISDLWNEFDRAFVAEMNVEINKFYDKSPVLDGFFAIDDHDTQYRVGKNILKIVISENEHKILSEVIPVNTNTNTKMVGI